MKIHKNVILLLTLMLIVSITATLFSLYYSYKYNELYNYSKNSLSTTYIYEQDDINVVRNLYNQVIADMTNIASAHSESFKAIAIFMAFYSMLNLVVIALLFKSTASNKSLESDAG